MKITTGGGLGPLPKETRSAVSEKVTRDFNR